MQRQTHRSISFIVLAIVSITFWSFSINFVAGKCEQKNVLGREAHRNVHRCTNQLFESGEPQADPHECQCYYHCNYRQQPCYMCCDDGKVFDPRTRTCVLSTAYACKPAPVTFRCKASGLFANDEHCRKYWHCPNPWSEPIEEGCPADHHWDDANKVCRVDTESSTYNRCG